MPRDYKKAQRERDKKKRSRITKGTKSSKTVPSTKPTASMNKSSRQKTYESLKPPIKGRDIPLPPSK